MEAFCRDAAGILADLLATIRDKNGILQLPGLTTPEPPPAVVEALQSAADARQQLAADGGLLQDCSYP